jgi:single-stranded DNA-binding protein
MAQITYTAFIESVIRNQSGDAFALKTSEPHRRKNDRDEWETTARTFRDVKVSRESGIQLAQFQDGERIDITGTEKTETRTDTNGKKHYSLVVWADSITRAGQSNPQPEYVPEDISGDPWATTPIPDDESVPF